MSNVFTNNAVGALASGITNVATSLTLGTGQGALFATLTGSDYSKVTIFQYGTGGETNHEIVKVTARTSDTLTIVRGQEGTTARAFSAGDIVECRVTADAMNNPNPTSVLYGRRAGFETQYDLGVSGSAITIPFDAYQKCKVTLNQASPALTLPTTGVLIGHYQLLVYQDATGGRSPSWVNISASKWLNAASAPTLNTASSGISVGTFFWTGSEWVGGISKVGVA